jgi:hypothetical protein
MKPIDLREFDAGVRWWRTKTTWPKDFHNADYKVLGSQATDGTFPDEWWAEFVPRLISWVALRPLSRAEVTDLLIANRESLSAAWHQACAPVKDLDISGVTWEQIHPFPDVVARLKPTRSHSAVFPSKFCHFLLPRIFPVFDNVAIGGSATYQRYFNLIKGTWEITPVGTQGNLIAQLTRLVEANGSGVLYAGFPMATKIAELALIGRKYGHLP